MGFINPRGLIYQVLIYEIYYVDQLYYFTDSKIVKLV